MFIKEYIVYDDLIINLMYNQNIEIMQIMKALYGGMGMSKIIEEIQRAKDNGISVPSKLNDNDIIRGIYGIFSENANESICIYIGRTYSIAHRLFDSGGHFSQFNNGDYEKLVPKLIHGYMSQGNRIVIRILDVVEYVGDNYYRDMQRLAFAETKQIEHYQMKNQCLWQLPEGTWLSEEKWEAKYGQNKYKV